MDINIKSIKALEEDKVYIAEMDPNSEMDFEAVSNYFQDLGITIFFVDKGAFNFVTVPDGVNGIQICQHK